MTLMSQTGDFDTSTRTSVLSQIAEKSGAELATLESLAAWANPFSAAEDRLQKLCKIDTMLGITPPVITEIPAAGLWINQPGTYRLGKDVTWTPDGSGQAAIVIAADNVTLDLGGHALKVVLGDDSQQIASILVLGAANVTILNGSLLDAGFRGIWARGAHGLTVSDMLISGVTFNNLTLRGASPAGVFAHQCSNVAIEKTTVQYMYCTSDVLSGIMLLEVTDSSVTDCTVSNLTNYDGSVQGISCYQSANIAWLRCLSIKLQSFFNGNIRTGGHTVLGFMPCLSVSVSVTACSAVEMIGSRDDCHGMSIFICAAVEAKTFTATGVVDGPAPYLTGAKSTGLEVYGWGITVEACTVSDIRATVPQDRQAAGFAAWGSGLSFTGCKASNVQVLDAAGKPDTTLGYGVGFGWSPDIRPVLSTTPAEGVLYTDCTAEGCQVGFDTFNHVKSVWTHATAKDCGVDILKADMQPKTRMLSADPASECNPPVVTTVTNQATGNAFV
ncbi:MAG: right-handed parallel beta-helix repeat-containing protein [Pseudomonadota bacterium]